MIFKTLAFQPDVIIFMCTVCVTDNNGGKIALTIIISSLFILGFANWGWKKYLSKKKEISQEK